MDRKTFREVAAGMWSEIPGVYREGIEALVVEENAVEHPEFAGVYTLGECLSQEWPSGYGEVADVRSRVVLYHGSFRQLDRRDPAFDWHAEIWETILHELLHHREFAAGERGLELYDRAVEENRRRHAGRPFDPDFYRLLPVGPEGAMRLGSEIFVESEAPASSDRAVFEWRDRRYSIRVPEGKEVLYVNPVNLAQGRLWAVVRRTLPWWQRLLGRGIAGEGAAQLPRRALPVPEG